jgi:polyvinyl alcohol dehydrogenase (cytochrome)
VRSRHITASALGLVALLALVGACSSDDSSTPTTASAATEQDECQWPTWGQSEARRFSYPCESEIAPDTVGDLAQAWFFNTGDVVTATPAVVDGTLYVGDWAGTFYAVDADTGDEIWSYETTPHDTVYSGQIVSSASVAEIDERQLVYFAGGKTLYALAADTGDEVWTHELGDPGDGDDPTEIQSSPVVVDELVVFGYDAHDRPGRRAGVRALDAATGDEAWDFDPDQGEEPTGCVGVWSSPSVDTERGLVFAGTANCTTAPEGWGEYTEALFALTLETGEPVWSYQPHDPNNDDFDFAGTPNLFEADDRALVGLGNKDAAYYAVDRETGEEVWATQATEPGIEERGSNFSTGGFIGPTAVADNTIVGGTAVGPCPCIHALDATTGDIVWQSDTPEPTYAAAAEVGGVVFLGGTDFTFRAYDLASGDILWTHEMSGVVAGGAAIVGNDVFAVAGIREPGTDAVSETSGVYRFTLNGDGPTDTVATTDSVGPANTDPVYLAPNDDRCIDAECVLEFNLFPPPEGLTPTATLEITTTPFSIRIVAEGLGEPIDWVSPASETFAEGATIFGAYLSTSDDNPTGTLVCVFDDSGVCAGGTIPVVEPQYNRLTILAVPDASFTLTPASGVPRLVTTTSFTPVLKVIESSEGD